MNEASAPASDADDDVEALMRKMQLESGGDSTYKRCGASERVLYSRLSEYDQAVRATDLSLDRVLTARECLKKARLPDNVLHRILSSCERMEPLQLPNRAKAMIDLEVAKAYLDVAEEVCPDKGLEPEQGKGCALTPWELADFNAVHAFSYAQRALEADPGFTPALLLRYEAMDVTVKSGALSQVKRKVEKLSEELWDHERRCHMCRLHTSYACLQAYKAGLISRTEAEFHIRKLRDRLLYHIWKGRVVSLNVSCEVSEFKVPTHNGESVMDTILSDKRENFLTVAASPVLVEPPDAGACDGCIWWIHLCESRDPSKILRTCMTVLEAAGGNVCALQYGRGMPQWETASNTAVTLDHDAVRTSLRLGPSVVISSQGLGCGKNVAATLAPLTTRPRVTEKKRAQQGGPFVVSNDRRRKAVMNSVISHLQSLGAPFRADLQ